MGPAYKQEGRISGVCQRVSRLFQEMARLPRARLARWNEGSPGAKAS